MTWPYEIRGAVQADEDQLLEVARHLNTVNLPNDRDEIRGILEQAQKSFTGAIKDPKRREYVFVLVDQQKKRIVCNSKRSPPASSTMKPSSMNPRSL